MNMLLKDERVQQAKKVSKQYFNFFLGALLHPYRSMRTVEEEQTLNGIISMALTALFSSFYFLFWFMKWDISPAFGPGFIKPLLFTAVGIAVAYSLMYAVLRMEKVSFAPKLLLARFGTLLVPVIAILLLSIFFLVCSLFTFSLSLLVLSYLFIFVAINAVLFQYPLGHSAGPIDTLFSVFIVNAVTAYIFYKLITSVVVGAIGGIMSGISPFGF
ncbi:hypothetical protein [Paenibacillus wynnii]|uniref:hypothetical protein n=1 Tax=Paenibacillus wynnii TaxID=268407 RepID=UPI0027949E53|nr:hypothetical protein [Paenibacillus wynnii]MDQ0195454.1 hypothetical protein [Paenibacillus wynnii]